MNPKEFIKIPLLFGAFLIIAMICMPAAFADEKEYQESNLQIQGVPYHFPPPLPGEEKNESKMNVLPESEYVLIESSQSRDSYDELHLYDGANYVSVPLWLEDEYSAYAEFFNGTDCAWILRWNSQNQYWTQVTNEEIVPLEGFVVIANSAQDVTYHFKAEQYQIPPTRYLYEGWNMVGSWHFPEWSARDNFISVVDDWTQAIGFDAENQQYETSIINGGSGYHSDERVIYPGKGYWLWMNDPATLVPLRGTADFHDSDFPQVGIEWSNGDNLVWSDETAIGFYNTLGDAGWVKTFEYGDSETQVDHFDVGDDWKYIDGVDIALFAGHGGFDWIRLDDDYLFFNGCEWGDYDLEWILLHGCHTTQYPIAYKAWPHWAMNGVHLVCGYDTVGWDCNDGTNISSRLLNYEPIKDAWFNGIDQTHNSSFRLRVIGEDASVGNDHIWGYGFVAFDPPVDQSTWDYWVFQCHDP
jgi:hypothetical protein